MGKRGRPTKSIIRDNIIDILYQLDKATGYTIAKIYNSIFPQVTIRVIYYHLRKGIDLGIFRISEVKKEEGDFSWGHDVEKIYYELTNKSTPRINEIVREYLSKNNIN